MDEKYIHSNRPGGTGFPENFLSDVRTRAGTYGLMLGYDCDAVTAEYVLLSFSGQTVEVLRAYYMQGIPVSGIQAALAALHGPEYQLMDAPERLIDAALDTIFNSSRYVILSLGLDAYIASLEQETYPTWEVSISTIRRLSLSALGLNAYLTEVLMAGGYQTAGSLMDLTVPQVAAIPGIGERGLAEILRALRSAGVFPQRSGGMKVPARGDMLLPIGDAGLPRAAVRALSRAGIRCLGDLDGYTPGMVMGIRGIGKRSAADIFAVLRMGGAVIPDDGRLE